MNEGKDPKSLEMRIVELENQLSQLQAAQKPVDISAEEMQAYIKVKGILQSDYGECGINECKPCIIPCIKVGSCYSCSTCFPCHLNNPPCIFECTCGPCNFGHITGGGGRFGGLGR